MSDSYLILIPTDPEYVPEFSKQQKAQELFSSFVPEADEIHIEVSESIRFVHQGSNWEHVTCPNCQNELTVSQWQELMDEAYQSEFSNLMVQMSCCGSQGSLNDLIYEWPAGFARFSIVAMNPNADIDLDQIQSLEQILGCKLRKIWRRS
jgi:hypothetical protein